VNALSQACISSNIRSVSPMAIFWLKYSSSIIMILSGFNSHLKKLGVAVEDLFTLEKE
jgi:hypothetical protein